MRDAPAERRARKRVMTIFGQRRGEGAATIGFFWTRARGEAIAGHELLARPNAAASVQLSQRYLSMEPTTLTTRVAALAALLILAGAALSGVLGACSPGGQAAGGGGAAATPAKFAGLDGEILKWRGEIIAEDPLCKQTAADQKCQGFDVACKAERTVTADDAAKGIVSRVVVSMTWTGFDPKFSHAQNGSRAAEFAKGASGWTRTDHKPVNMNTCGDL